VIVFALLLISCGLALFRKRGPLFVFASLAGSVSAFVAMYARSGIEVAQDREAYYLTYLHPKVVMPNTAVGQLLNIVDGEVLFHLFMRALPDGLALAGFSVLFMSCWVLVFLAVLFVASNKGLIAFDALPLVALSILFDRMVIDLVFNTTQSSYAGLIYLVGLLSGSWSFFLLFLFMALQFHGRMALLMSAILLPSVLFRRFKTLVFAAFALGMAFFILRLAYPDILLQTGLALGLGRVREILFLPLFSGIWLDYPLTPSIFVQIVLALVLPLAFLILQFRQLRHSSVPSVISGGKSGSLKLFGQSLSLDFAVFIVCAGLLFFPEISLVQRVLLVPAVLLPLFLSEGYLGRLTLFKVSVFIAIAVRHPFF